MALVLTGWSALVVLDPALPGSAPGTVKAGYEHWAVRGLIAFQVPAGTRPTQFRYGEGIYTNSNGFPHWAPIQVRLR